MAAGEAARTAVGVAVATAGVVGATVVAATTVATACGVVVVVVHVHNVRRGIAVTRGHVSHHRPRQPVSGPGARAAAAFMGTAPALLGAGPSLACTLKPQTQARHFCNHRKLDHNNVKQSLLQPRVRTSSC